MQATVNQITGMVADMNMGRSHLAMLSYLIYQVHGHG